MKNLNPLTMNCKYPYGKLFHATAFSYLWHPCQIGSLSKNSTLFDEQISRVLQTATPLYQVWKFAVSDPIL